LGAKSVEILAARKPDGVNPDALVFSTDKGTPFDRRNLVNRQLKPTCKKIGLTGVGWHWLRHANATLPDTVGTPLVTVQADARAAVQKVGESSKELLPYRLAFMNEQLLWVGRPARCRRETPSARSNRIAPAGCRTNPPAM